MRILVSNTYCVVFLSSYRVPILPVSLDCPYLIAHSVFSNVYLHTINHETMVTYALKKIELNELHYLRTVYPLIKRGGAKLVSGPKPPFSEK